MELMTGKRILIIEDDAHIAEGLMLNLGLQGYEVKTVANGIEGLQQWQEYRPHLIVLDLMLPGVDGMHILKNIRLEDERLPILILSAKAENADKIKGFRYGVDDYLAKPFNLEEFLLRIKRLLTRDAWQHEQEKINEGRPPGPGAVYTFGGNRIDFVNAMAWGRGNEIKLTGQELKLLKLFVTNRGKPLSRRRLMEIGWGYAPETTTRTVDNFIVRFRKYFEENPKKPVYFKSLRAIGYVFDHQ